MVTNSSGGRKPSSNTSSKNGQKGDFLSIQAWRMTKTEDSLERDGKQWYWCPHHKMEGSYDGLYVTHKPEEHDEWKNNKAQFRKKRYEASKNNDSHDTSKEEDSAKKLTINDNMKAALLTHCDLTGAQIDEMIEKAQAQSDF